MSLTAWCIRKCRSLVGMSGLSARSSDPEPEAVQPGLQPAQTPCQVEINGDLFWLPRDLLDYIWHTRMPDAGSKVPRFLAETPHYRWIRERLRPGDVALDCGANLGLFTVMMARSVGRRGVVHAFEPSPGALGDLVRVLRMNRVGNVVVSSSALSDQCGEALFCDITDGDVRREASHLDLLGRIGFLQEKFNVRDHRPVRVPTVTLDAYTAEHSLAPALMKIDVEGAELLVLEGARRCVAANRPALVIEVHVDGEGRFDHDRLGAYLREHGYRFAAEDKVYYCEP